MLLTEPTDTGKTKAVLRKPWLLMSMLLSVAFVGALAAWDEVRESDAALDDFGLEQTTLAATVATDLSTRLGGIQRDARLIDEEAQEGRPPPRGLQQSYLSIHAKSEHLAPDAASSALSLWIPVANGRGVGLRTASSELLEGLRKSERPGAVRIYVLAPGENRLRSMEGSFVTSSRLIEGLRGEANLLRLSRPEAANVGLPERTAMAGLARVDAGSLGRWGVAVVASAERQRDRERRASWRLVLAVGTACALVAGFGGFALSKQRQELELARKLELAEATRERDERLIRLSRAATTLTLASGFAHELGTPLAVISGRAEQLAERVAGDERGSRSVHVILQETERIHQLMRGFLNLARGGTPTLERVEPKLIVESAVALVAHRFSEADVKLELQIQDGLPPQLCDLRLLEHALVNLLLNACDASPPGASVEVRADVTGDTLRLAVTDEGTGIAPADAARVMEPFFTTKPEGRGSGLGLAIASEIAKSHHGSLTLGRSGGRGTRAALELPLQRGEATHG